MAEYEVEVADEFEVECPEPNCIDPRTGESRNSYCQVCKGEGRVTVWVEGTTTVEIEPPGA